MNSFVQVTKSNKTIYFRQIHKGKVILSLDLGSILKMQNLSSLFLIEKNSFLFPLFEQFNTKNIKYSTLKYIFSKYNKETSLKQNLDEKSIQLLTEWSLESGFYDPSKFHFKY